MDCGLFKYFGADGTRQLTFKNHDRVNPDQSRLISRLNVKMSREMLTVEHHYFDPVKEANNGHDNT
jgi:hypothetical protein